eukprot:m51a1_g7892 putative c3hc4-type ring finger-containing protein (508) ;mRNA; r:90357-92743
MEKSPREDCPICLQPMAKGAALFQTACGHIFHFDCIRDSIDHRIRDCPMCKAPLPQMAPDSSVSQDDSFFADLMQTNILASQRPSPSIPTPPALQPPNRLAPYVRCAVDIVAVVDTNSSMSGEKMAHTRSALRFLLTQLGPRDRVAIVSFSSTSEVVCHLRRATEDAKPVIEALLAMRLQTAAGGPALWKGLRTALDILNARSTANDVSSIFLLTDGQNCHNTEELGASMETLEELLPLGCSVNTFGYGAEHNAQLCADVARVGNGRYTYVRTNESLGEAFATVLGSLLTTVAQSIEVTVQTQGGVKLLGVRTAFSCTDSDEGKLVEIPEMSEGETRDLCLSFAVPPAALPAEEQSVATVQVRLSVGEALSKASELAGNGDIPRARGLLVSLLSTPELVSYSSELEKSLFTDLTEGVRRLRDEAKWRAGGKAFLLSAAQQQSQQRSTAMGTLSSALYTTQGSVVQSALFGKWSRTQQHATAAAAQGAPLSPEQVRVLLMQPRNTYMR